MWDQFVIPVSRYTELGKILGSDNLQLEICFLSQAVGIYMEKSNYCLYYVLFCRITGLMLFLRQHKTKT